MEFSTFERRELDQRADEIERALSELSLPARVAGGRIRADGVCYQLAPLDEPLASQIERVSRRLAIAIGEPELRVLREPEGIAIDVPQDVDRSLRLLPLQRVVGELPPLTALLGLAGDGRPFAQSFSQPNCWHLLVEGPQGSGKSEALRTILMSFARRHHPIDLHLAGIDIGGRELAVIEALPHNIARLASDGNRACDLLRMIAKELEERVRLKLREPELVLLIDELESLGPSLSPNAKQALAFILQHGDSAGVHVFVGSQHDHHRQTFAVMPQGKTVHAVSSFGGAEPGVFDLSGGNSRRAERVEMAWLPTSDLDEAIGAIQIAWSDRFPGNAVNPLP